MTWAAQAFGPGVRAWRAGDAVTVASTGLSRRDRLAVAGPVSAVTALVRHAFAEVGPALRPLGPPGLIAALCRRIPSLHIAASFGWMQTAAAPDADERAAQLAGCELAQVDALLESAFPGSYARPGIAGVRRWWGVVEEGRVQAVDADNAAPRRLYASLGFAWRDVAAAGLQR